MKYKRLDKVKKAQIRERVLRSRDRKKRVKANDLLHSEGMRGDRGGTYHYSKNFSRRCGFEKKEFLDRKKIVVIESLLTRKFLV